MKKKILLIIVASLAFAAASPAQEKGSRTDWHERMKAQKIAFLTDRIELTSDEATVFWPVYNRAENEKKASFKEILDSYMALNQALKDGKGDSEIKSLLNKYFEAKAKNDAIDRTYMDEYLKVLPAAKVAKLYLGEEQFRRKQISDLGVKYHSGNGAPRGGKPGGRQQRDGQGENKTKESR